MPVIKKSQALDIDRPSGAQHAVFADIAGPYPDINPLNGQEKEQMIITWQLAATYTDSNGKIQRFLHSEFCTPSVHKKSKLRGWIHGLVGRDIPDAAFPDNFNTDTLLGKNCTLILVKNEEGYTKLQTLTGPAQGMPVLVLEGYKRPEWINDHIAVKTRQHAAFQSQQANAPANAALAAAAVVPGTLDAILAMPQASVMNAAVRATPTAPVIAKNPAAQMSIEDVLKTI